MNLNEIERIKTWLKNYIKTANANGIIVGMSGGKDSLITAKLCADAIGKENVLGLIMPNGEMKDISVAKECCQVIGIKFYEINIKPLFDTALSCAGDIIKKEGKNLSTVTSFNIPPRLRTLMLYSVAGSLNYLVANTSNLSEGMVGYTTKWGDNVGDFSLLANFTKTEVCEIGLLLGLPEKLVNKIPDDGLSGQTDEEKLGFSYKELDSFIRNGIIGSGHEKILRMHKISQHKRTGVVKYENNLKNYFN